MTSTTDMANVTHQHGQHYRPLSACIARGMSPLEFISFLDEEIDEQVPVAVTRLIRLVSFGGIFQSRFVSLQFPQEIFPPSLIVSCLSLSPTCLVVPKPNSTVAVLRSSGWPPAKWEDVQSKFNSQHQWGSTTQNCVVFGRLLHVASTENLWRSMILRFVRIT